jgi:hypothetical protein
MFIVEQLDGRVTASEFERLLREPHCQITPRETCVMLCDFSRRDAQVLVGIVSRYNGMHSGSIAADGISERNVLYTVFESCSEAYSCALEAARFIRRKTKAR